MFMLLCVCVCVCMFVSASAGGDVGKFSLVWLTGLKVIFDDGT